MTGGAAGAAIAGQTPTGPAINDDYHEPQAGAAGQGEMRHDTEGHNSAQMQGRAHASTAGSAAPMHAEMHAGGDTDSGSAAGGTVHAGSSAVGQGDVTYEAEDRSGGQMQSGTHTTATGSGAEIHSELRAAGDEPGAAEGDQLTGVLPAGW